MTRIEEGFKFAVILEIKGVKLSNAVSVDNLIMMCVYLPPQNSSTYDEETDGVLILKEKLVELKSKFPEHKLIVLGDLNARIGSMQDILVDADVEHVTGFDWYITDDFDIPRQSKDTVTNDFGRSLIESCTELDMHVLNGRAPGDTTGQYTNVTENGCSVVDYVIVESSLYEHVDSFKVLDLAETNHMPVECVLNMCTLTEEDASHVNTPPDELTQQCKFKWKEEFRTQYIGKLSDETAATSFTNFTEQIDEELIDEAVSVLEGILQRAAESMEISSNRRQRKSLQPKWWDKHCSHLKTCKYKALKRFKESNTREDLTAYRVARSEFKNYCKQNQTKWKDELKQKLLDNRSDPAKFWKTVKCINEKHMVLPSLNAKEWFTYFEKLLNQEVNINVEFEEHVSDFTADHDTHCRVCSGQEDGSEEVNLVNSPITLEEIVQCIKSMANGKSCGIDGIVVEMLKASIDITGPYLRHLYNNILASGKFPKQWCKAVLVPIHKKGSMSDPNNYRGIALLSVLGKVFTKVINKRLVNWAESANLQKEEQAGFRKGYSTVDNMFTLQSLVQKYCSRAGGRFYVLFVDFSKAFDTIPHSLLFYQLMTKGLHGNVLKVLRSMYSSLQSCVRTPQGLTDFFECSRGTRQGCMLSPFLFSLYVGEIVTMLEEADCKGVFINDDIPNLTSLLFADDLAVCADTVGRLQKMIDVIAKLCDRWGLSVNMNKSKVMVFRNGGPLRLNEKWFFNGIPLGVVSAYKYLGAMFTPKLVWTLCQKTLAAQASRGLYLLKKYNYACNGLPVDVQFDLFDKMIAPILMYSSEVWGFAVADRIERVQTGFCKYVLGVPSHTPNIAVLAETGRLPMYVQYYKRCIKYWMKLLNMPNTRYPKACYNMLYLLDQQGRKTWASSVRQLLCMYGFRGVWDMQGVENVSLFLREFTDRVKQKYITEWEYEVAQSSKLYLFRMLNSECDNMQSYLYSVNFKKYRSGLAKLRCSAHSLRIEKGRHLNELTADRVCELCLKNRSVYVLEDEYHFVMCCPSFSDLRESYLSEITQSYECFLNLLCDTDEDTVIRVASYIFQATKLRSNLIKLEP